MDRHFTEGARASAKVLDVAAGTGKVGEELDKIGFRNMEALGEVYTVRSVGGRFAWRIQ